MQPTTNQTVPATSSVPSQTGTGQPASDGRAPVPLNLSELRQVSGGVHPTGSW